MCLVRRREPPLTNKKNTTMDYIHSLATELNTGEREEPPELDKWGDPIRDIEDEPEPDPDNV